MRQHMCKIFGEKAEFFMTKILFDTDVIINILKKKKETLERLQHLKGCEFYLSPIVIAEIYAGARPTETE